MINPQAMKGAPQGVPEKRAMSQFFKSGDVNRRVKWQVSKPVADKWLGAIKFAKVSQRLTSTN